MGKTKWVVTIIFAALALFSAVGPAGASAAPLSFSAGNYEASVSGEQTNTNTFSNGVKEFSCSLARLTATLDGPSESLEITPAYEGCTGNAGTTMTVEPSGCIYVFTLTGGSTATESIKCPQGKQIEISSWASGRNHNEPKLCEWAVGPQGPLSGVTYKDLGGAKGIQAKIAIGNFTWTRTLGTAANCGAAVKTTATYDGEIHLTAKHDGVATTLAAG